MRFTQIYTDIIARYHEIEFCYKMKPSFPFLVAHDGTLKNSENWNLQLSNVQFNQGEKEHTS